MSRWGTAEWDTDRWPALTVADLCQQSPLSDRGRPIGVGDWRVVVEMLLPAEPLSLWGVGEWGTAEWNTLAWVDITDDVRGAEWSRGADQVYGRARAGQLTLDLDSNADQYDPWNPDAPNGANAYLAPGTLVRIGVVSPTDTRARGWIPQITAVVDTWAAFYVDGNKADRYVRVTAFETVTKLANIDDNALSGVVGGGETVADRIQRLLDAAGWPYGLLVEAQHLIAAPGSYPVQSTDMASNRLAECYLTADSADVYFRSDRTGAALLTNVEYETNVGPLDPDIVPLTEFSSGGYFGVFYARSTSGGIEYVPYSTESFESVNSADAIVNDCRFSRVGGTQQVFEQDASIQRYGRVTLVRNDFIVTNDPVVAQIAEYITVRRALNTLRVENVTCDVTDMDELGGLCCLAVDVGNRAIVFPPQPTTPPASPYISGFVRSMTHRFTPRSTGSVTWQTDYAFDTRRVENLPGAQLPATEA